MEITKELIIAAIIDFPVQVDKDVSWTVYQDTMGILSMKERVRHLLEKGRGVSHEHLCRVLNDSRDRLCELYDDVYQDIQTRMIRKEEICEYYGKITSSLKE